MSTVDVPRGTADVAADTHQWLDDRGGIKPGVRRRLEDVVFDLRWRILLQSVEWFFQHCLQIPAATDDGDGRVPFDLWAYQRQSLQEVMAHRKTVVLKARQLGWTSIMSGLALWQALHKGSTVLYVSKNQDAANKALSLVRFMWTFLPTWVRVRAPKLTSDQSTRMEWTWPDGSKSLILSLAATKTAGAGETADLVLVDEFALGDNQDDALRTLLPTISARQGRMVVFSTARGAHNRFASLFLSAWNDEGSDFHAIFHPWMVSRIFDADDYEAEKVRFASKPWLLFAEYPSSVEEAFRESGRPRFTALPTDAAALPMSASIVGRFNDTSGETMKVVPDDEHMEPSQRGMLRGWPELHSPRAGFSYVLAIDPSSGTGGDNAVMHVMRRDGRDVKIVAAWASNMVEPIHAARHAAAIGHWFNDALIVVETTGGWGDSYINELAHHLDYPNLYVHVDDKPRQGRANRYGYPMSWQKRPKVVDRLASLLRYDLVEANQPVVDGLYRELLTELNTFVVREDGKVAADVGCHDDRVMSLGIGVSVLTDHVDQVGHSPADRDVLPEKKAGNLVDLVKRQQQINRDRLKAERKDHRKMMRAVARKARRRNRRRL